MSDIAWPWLESTGPRPAGAPIPTEWELFLAWLPDWMMSSGMWIEEFFRGNFAWIFLAVLGLLFLKIWLNRLSVRKQQIHKLWLFLLFFLGKRLMLIPLVVTLARKQKLLPAKKSAELLSIRQQCRDTSLKKNPHERLKLEKTVSESLFQYFAQLEKDGKLAAKSKLTKVVSDLEFIDQKIVELQNLYNHEVALWNQKVMKLQPVKKVVRVFGTLDPFA